MHAYTCASSLPHSHTHIHTCLCMYAHACNAYSCTHTHKQCILTQGHTHTHAHSRIAYTQINNVTEILISVHRHHAHTYTYTQPFFDHALWSSLKFTTVQTGRGKETESTITHTHTHRGRESRVQPTWVAWICWRQFLNMLYGHWTQKLDEGEYHWKWILPAGRGHLTNFEGLQWAESKKKITLIYNYT